MCKETKLREQQAQHIPVLAVLAMAASSVLLGQMARDRPAPVARMPVQAIEPVPTMFSYVPKFRCARITKFEPWGKSAPKRCARPTYQQPKRFSSSVTFHFRFPLTRV